MPTTQTKNLILKGMPRGMNYVARVLGLYVIIIGDLHYFVTLVQLPEFFADFLSPSNSSYLTRIARQLLLMN